MLFAFNKQLINYIGDFSFQKIERRSEKRPSFAKPFCNNLARSSYMNHWGMTGSFWGQKSMGVLRLQIMRVVVSELIVAEREGFEPSKGY